MSENAFDDDVFDAELLAARAGSGGQPCGLCPLVTNRSHVVGRCQCAPCQAVARDLADLVALVAAHAV